MPRRAGRAVRPTAPGSRPTSAARPRDLDWQPRRGLAARWPICGRIAVRLRLQRRSGPRSGPRRAAPAGRPAGGARVLPPGRRADDWASWPGRRARSGWSSSTRPTARAPARPGLQPCLSRARAGVRVAGYVDTNYGRRSARAALADIGRYRDWYDVAGVLFDRVSAGRTTSALRPAGPPRPRAGAHVVAFNHGVHPLPATPGTPTCSARSRAPGAPTSSRPCRAGRGPGRRTVLPRGVLGAARAPGRCAAAGRASPGGLRLRHRP